MEMIQAMRMRQSTSTDRTRPGTEESKTYRNLLALVVELTGELLIHDPLPSEDV